MANLPSDSKDVGNFYYTKKHIKHPSITIGEYTYGLPAINIAKPGATITIGKFCSLAPTSKLSIASEHRPDWITTYPFAALRSDWPEAASIPIAEAAPCRGNIVIGNDVWIGNNATILAGVTIGDGAVIGAYSVVAKDVAPYSVVVGNPIREIRRRFSDEVIQQLLCLAWWDWPIEKIQKHAALLSSNNIETLLGLKDEQHAA
jgi:virginiamycin A acetyltransferase